jgi:hypothetical protein
MAAAAAARANARRHIDPDGARITAPGASSAFSVFTCATSAKSLQSLWSAGCYEAGLRDEWGPQGAFRVITAFRAVLFIAALVAMGRPAAAQNIARIEQDNPSIVYSGNWYSNTSNAHSQGLAALTNTRGARATLTFTGTGIAWLGVKDGWSGLANVYLDGRMQVVDTFGSGGYQQALFAAGGLSSGPHTLSIEVTHERNDRTQGSWVWIDAFLIENGEPVPGGVTATIGRVEENHPALVYSGRWFANAGTAHSRGAVALAMDAGARVTVAFEGTGIRWIGYRDEWSGVARIFVDGDLKSTVDAYLAPSHAQATLYQLDGLAPGPHTLAIEATGTRNESAKGSWIWVDSFDVVR